MVGVEISDSIGEMRRSNDRAVKSSVGTEEWLIRKVLIVSRQGRPEFDQVVGTFDNMRWVIHQDEKERKREKIRHEDRGLTRLSGSCIPAVLFCPTFSLAI